MKYLIPLSVIAILLTIVAVYIGFSGSMPLYDQRSNMLTVGGPGSAAFWVKVFFSGTFCISAGYVVLSRKYNDETKKWTFSILTLIACVWIGTVTK